MNPTNTLMNISKQNTKKILDEIKKLAKSIGRETRLMGLCGTHSQTIAQYGLKNLLPRNIKLVAGPGCPVCVTAREDIDTVIGLALAGIPLAVYGDTLAVPGSTESLENARQKGADIKIIYSIKEALEEQKIKPDLVFFGVGFETTAPMTAWAIKQGLRVYSAHKFFPPAMAALLKNKKNKIDGLIDPGHVSAIIGESPYKKFEIPQVITGFEPEDVLMAVLMLLNQIAEGKRDLENEYGRVVKKNGNEKAINLINEVFEQCDAEWRGIGLIKNSGMKIRKKYSTCDTKIKYRRTIAKILSQTKTKKTACLPDRQACRCGEILQGLIEPNQCPLFKKICTPKNPFGACMVSIEGTCNIEYKYAR